jgi:hypothetical protein
MQSAPGNFTAMLKEVSGRFQDTAASYEAVQELEHTIASLQQIKNGLEETKEYRAAQAEKERASKGDRVQQLQKRVEESKVMMHVSSLKRSRRRSPRVPPTVYPQK